MASLLIPSGPSAPLLLRHSPFRAPILVFVLPYFSFCASITVVSQPSASLSLSLPRVFPPTLSGMETFLKLHQRRGAFSLHRLFAGLQPLTAQLAALLPHSALQTLPKALEKKLAVTLRAGQVPLLLYYHIRSLVTKSCVVCGVFSSGYLSVGLGLGLLPV